MTRFSLIAAMALKCFIHQAVGVAARRLSALLAPGRTTVPVRHRSHGPIEMPDPDQLCFAAHESDPERLRSVRVPHPAIWSAATLPSHRAGNRSESLGTLCT